MKKWGKVVEKWRSLWKIGEKKMDFVEINGENLKDIEKIAVLEQEFFGEGGINLWVLKPFSKYGKIYCLKKDNEIKALCEVIMGWEKKTVFIFSFGVKDEYRGKGVGYELMINVLEKIKSENVEKIELTVNPLNLAGVKLYKKCGFIVEKELKNEYGNGEDRYLMGLKVQK